MAEGSDGDLLLIYLELSKECGGDKNRTLSKNNNCDRSLFQTKNTSVMLLESQTAI